MWRAWVCRICDVWFYGHELIFKKLCHYIMFPQNYTTKWWYFIFCFVKHTKKYQMIKRSLKPKSLTVTYLKSHLQFKDKTKTNVRARTSIGPFISTTVAYWSAQDRAGWSRALRPKFHRAEQSTSVAGSSCIRPLLNEFGRHA